MATISVTSGQRGPTTVDQWGWRYGTHNIIINTRELPEAFNGCTNCIVLDTGDMSTDRANGLRSWYMNQRIDNKIIIGGEQNHVEIGKYNLGDMQDKISAFVDQSDKIDKFTTKLKKQKYKMREQNSEIHTSVHQNTSEISDLRDENDRLRSEISELRSQLDTLSGHLQETRNILQMLIDMDRMKVRDVNIAKPLRDST